VGGEQELNLQDALVVLALVAVLVFMAIVLWKAGLRRPSAGQVEMALIGTAAGPQEIQMWGAALKTAGIECHVSNVGDFAFRGTSVNDYELWVPHGDATRAREVLGF
jgi:hypothetical protein